MGVQEESNDSELDYIVEPVTSSLSPSCKELTQAMRIQQSSLEKKMQSCLDELRQICLREAELTGVLPKDYPLKPGETPPKVRRRVGALFKLDERTIHCQGKDPLGCLERDLALQRQITEAARRLYMEESVSRHVRQQRKAALKAAEQKLSFLENRLIQEQTHENLQTDDNSSVSESSSLSDVAMLGEDDSLQRVQQVNRPLRPQTLEGLYLLRTDNENDTSPIQNSPWRESSLDLPYDKNQRRSCNSQSSSRNSSPAVTPISEKSFTDSDNNLNLAKLCLQDSPQRSNKKLVSYSMRVQSVQGDGDIRGRTTCRRATSFNNSQNNSLSTLSLLNPVYISSNPLYTSNSSESLSDSSNLQPSYNLAYCPLTPKGNILLVSRTPSVRDHNVMHGPSKSEVTEELRCWHARARMRGADAIRPRSLDRKGAVKIRRGVSWSQAGISQRMQMVPVHVLRRTAEGAPLQWYDPEEAQIISQV